jgi:hypothetical protein
MGNLACLTRGLHFSRLLTQRSNPRLQARRWYTPRKGLTRPPSCRPCTRSAARRFTACLQCSSPSLNTRTYAKYSSATVALTLLTHIVLRVQMSECIQYDLSSLRTGVMAGSPCPIEVMKKVSRFQCIYIFFCCLLPPLSFCALCDGRRC